MTLRWSRSSLRKRVQSASWRRILTSPCRQSRRWLRSLPRSTSRSVRRSSMSQCLSIDQVTQDAVLPQKQFAAVPAVIQRQVPLPSLTQMTKHDGIPQTQYTDKVVAVLIAMQRQVPQSPTVRKTGEAPLAQFIGNSADVPLINQINHVTKHVEIPQTQYTDKVVAVLIAMQRQIPQLPTV